MEKEKQQELYDQHKRLIEAEVWRACRTLPDIPREELVSDAEQVFCECCQGWTPIFHLFGWSFKECVCAWVLVPLPIHHTKCDG
jgi:hypothetical protein